MRGSSSFSIPPPQFRTYLSQTYRNRVPRHECCRNLPQLERQLCFLAQKTSAPRISTSTCFRLQTGKYFLFVNAPTDGVHILAVNSRPMTSIFEYEYISSPVNGHLVRARGFWGFVWGKAQPVHSCSNVDKQLSWIVLDAGDKFPVQSLFASFPLACIPSNPVSNIFNGG